MGDELARLSAEVEADTLRRWIWLNDQADALFGAMPADQRQRILDDPADLSVLIPALALTHPLQRQAHRAIVADMIARIEGSLSHPSVIINAERPSDEVRVEMDEAEIEQRIADMERRTRQLEQIAERFTSALDRVERELDRAGH